jgi:hypothetical protein
MQIANEIEDVVSGLEMVLMEEVIALREAIKNGASLTPADIAAGYLNPSCGRGEELSSEDHTMGLACMVAVALHWLAHQEGFA